MAGRRYGGQTMVEMSSTIFSDKRTWRCLSVVWRKSSQDYLYDISMQLCLEKKIHTERAAQIGVSFRECHSNPLLTLTEWISHRRLVCLWLWCKAFFFFEINVSAAEKAQLRHHCYERQWHHYSEPRGMPVVTRTGKHSAMETARVWSRTHILALLY